LRSKKKRKEKSFWVGISKSKILEEFDNKITDFSFSNILFDIRNIELLDINDLEIVYQLIPSKTKNEIHLNIYRNSLPLLASKLLRNKRSYREDNDDDSDIYLLRRHIFKKFANFILEKETDEIDLYLKPFIDDFNSNEETSFFIDEIISAEDLCKRPEQFWYIWNKLYSKFIETCNNSQNFYLNQVINNYLLAWQWWREGIEEWHSLKEENLSFYSNVSKDLGHIPSVLYSITKILNSIGSNFKKEGIDWIFIIISNNKSLKMGDLESNTLYYLERFIRKFIFLNKGQIKHEIRLKNKVLPILDFMIERGSIHGYLLRESIL